MARRTFAHTVHIDAPRQQVWSALQKPETWETIGGIDRIHDAVIDGEGRLEGFAFEARAGGQVYPGLASPETMEEGRVMSWAIDTPEIEGIVRVELQDAGLGTECTVSIEVSSRTILSAVFFPAIASAIGNGLPDAVEEFGREQSGGNHSSSS